MLQIQKQNKFLKAELISGTDARDLTPKISKTPEQQAVMKESREQRNALSSETLERGQKNEMVTRAQAMLQRLGLYNKALDGDFGSGTEAAVKSFQTANGLNPDGKIGVKTALKLVRAFQKEAGLKVDGIVGPNTLAALGNSSERVTTSVAAPAAAKEAPREKNRNPITGFFEALFGKSTEKIRYNKFDSLSQIDNIINSASGLGDLEKAIDAIKNTKSQANVDRVYAQMLQVLKARVPANLYAVLSDARNTLEKAYVLSFVVNALMGGKKAPERINMNNVSSIIAADAKNGSAQDREMSKALGINISNLRKMAHQGVKARNTYEQRRDSNKTKRVVWSLRSKHIGDAILSGLQPLAGSAIETVKINGNSDSINFKLDKNLLARLVDNLDSVQLNSIKRNVLNNTRLSDERVKEMILKGDIKSTAFYTKSGNCFNDAIGLSFKYVKPIRESDRDGGRDNPGDNGSVGTNPGVDGGGDVGGGGPGGGNDSGRG